MANANQLDAVVSEFERQWGVSPPDFAAYVTERTFSPLELIELVLVDMELRWKHTAGLKSKEGPQSPPRLSEYTNLAVEMPSLDNWPAEYVAEEYRIRKRFGDNPSIEEYLREFPQQRNRLAGLLPYIDQQIAVDRDVPYQHPAILPVHVFDPRAPLSADNFVLQRHLASGGSSRVFRAWHKTRQQHVAIKVLRKKFQQNSTAIEHLLNEASALEELRHPNIISVHGLGRFPNGVYFLAMDYIPGQDLERRLAESQLSIPNVIRLAKTLVAAVEYAHGQGVVHRDLKPANILLDGSDEPYIADYGLAATRTSSIALHSAGTPHFMAPEQWKIGPAASHPSVDIYAIGMTLAAILPNEEIPTRLQAIVEKCCEHEPSNRYLNCTNLLDDLMEI